MKTLEKIEVLEIKDKNSFLIKGGTLNSYQKYLINGKEVSNTQKRNDILISGSDLIEFLPSSKNIVRYKKGNEFITVEEFNSKPQYYDEDDSEESVLRAIANRRELKGFEPEYEEIKPQKVDLSIVGYIEDTGSDFISCVITNRFNNQNIVFVTCGNRIALDEYKKLSEEYQNHAKFEKPDRDYLRFTKVNGNYAFGDNKPFGDRSYSNTFTSLEEAKKEEKWIRERVKNVVESKVFREEPTEFKTEQILSIVKSIKKLKTKKSMDELLDILIKDLNNYLKII